jgi:hypothetical protein
MTVSDLTDGNEDIAGERMDMLISLAVTTVAAMVNLPLTADDAVDGRRKVTFSPFVKWILHG